MEKKIVKSLGKEMKEIKVAGQGCYDDCENWHEVSGQNYYYASMMPCYSHVCSGYYTYDAFWTKRF